VSASDAEPREVPPLPTSLRTVLLTGANGGIGLALVDHLLADGFDKLICQYRTSSEALFETVRRHGLDPAHHCFQADLSNESEVQALGDAIEKRHGVIWGLVNLAGSTSNGVSWKLSLEDFQRVLGDSLVSTFLTCRRFIPAMRQARGGRIVNVSSVVAFAGVAGASHYGAAKAGVVGYTKSVARELASREVTANVLALGYYDYGMMYTIPEEVREQIRASIPVGRLGSAAEIGGMLEFLLSDEGAYTTGQILHVNGGLYG
jgi:3-oxoacyl-[acyl-carrier protein] reductase